MVLSGSSGKTLGGPLGGLRLHTRADVVAMADGQQYRVITTVGVVLTQQAAAKHELMLSWSLQSANSPKSCRQ